MADKIYLQTSSQNHAGTCVGCNDEDKLMEKENEVEPSLSSDSGEFAHFFAGNIAKRITEMVKCEEYETQLIEARDLADTSKNAYLLAVLPLTPLVITRVSSGASFSTSATLTPLFSKNH